ncbi:hypothetical protein M409DRAFT_54795 [Zasmidium cellare ATCC 36951]|uniref:Uncharacterized protein n=1 Tax=Zasmidium cellare ATCC 36951 TaxID=1080233 RepID=A0A6A6CGS9_ZASCE|nr:uncharacterized protein M409DRAFT_54795 [Zasmidium cellare ATCC 36951]KAF2166447.1 hypothetical protein M409DRAFT_54795 [Zasmidium cellare ATCC 36951]
MPNGAGGEMRARLLRLSCVGGVSRNVLPRGSRAAGDRSRAGGLIKLLSGEVYFRAEMKAVLHQPCALRSVLLWAQRIDEVKSGFAPAGDQSAVERPRRRHQFPLANIVLRSPSFMTGIMRCPDRGTARWILYEIHIFSLNMRHRKKTRKDAAESAMV